MRNWTRLRVAGGTYFFTVVTANRQPCFDAPLHVRCLGAALRQTRASHPFTMDALVVLPDHLHCIWTLPAHDHDYSLRWALIKKRCSTGLRRIAPSMIDRRVWQPRFWEHRIRDEMTSRAISTTSTTTRSSTDMQRVRGRGRTPASRASFAQAHIARIGERFHRHRWPGWRRNERAGS